MNKCLVTKLNGVVNDTSLLKLGEIKFKTVETENFKNSNNSINIAVSSNAKMRIIGNGYFTDANYERNLGKEISLTPGRTNDIYFYNGNYDICISNKYAISFIQLNGSNNSFNIEGLNYAKDIKSILLSNCVGDLSNLSGLSKVTKIGIRKDSKIHGNIANLANNTELKDLLISKADIYGDLSSLRYLNKLEAINFESTKVEGDISLLAPSVKFVQLSSSYDQVYLWNNTRASNSKIIAIYGNPRISNVDSMLNNQSQCQVGFTSSDDPSYKYIQVIGKRTSASDTAVSRLQELGYTVSVTDI